MSLQDLEQRILNLERLSKKVGMNQNLGKINNNRIRVIEGQVKNIDASATIQSMQNNCDNQGCKIKSLEQKLRNIEYRLIKQERIDRSIVLDIEANKTYGDQIEELRQENEALRKQIRTNHHQINSKLTNFKAQILPEIERTKLHRQTRERRRR